jgi:uncharacterized protein (TIGR02300 family)
MSTAARGTKRVCPSCGARFYDLNRSPIICPVCQSVYQVAAPGRRSRAAVANAVEPVDENEEVEVETTEDAEVISLEDAEESTEGDGAEADDEDIPDIAAEDDPELPDDGDDDDTFLEDDEDDDDDRVSGLLGGASDDDEG